MRYSFKSPEANLFFSIAIALEKSAQKLEKKRDKGEISNDSYLKIKFLHFDIAKKTREELEEKDVFFPKIKSVQIENKNQR